MCGIIGYIGKEKAIPILIDGLKRLEYRGYDSAGVAVFNNGKISLARAKGRISELEKKVPINWNGHIGIAHTRWATHGEPSEINAHPHPDCRGKVFVCHNGIIENYKELKENLILRGHKFKSGTDTEVLSHLIEENLRYGPELSVVKSLGLVKGTYGLAVIFTDYPDRIIAARNSSPLVIGIGRNEHLIASDASAILSRTKNVIYMKAVLKRDNIKLFDIAKALKFKDLNISGRKETLDWDIDDIQKGGQPHFMLKEIFEQPDSILNSFRGRLLKKEGDVKLGGLESIKNKLKKVNRIIITGCGTAYLAGMIGRLMIEELSGIPCEVELASELRYRNPPADGQNLAMVAVSQSGETADTLAATRLFKKRGVLTLGIVNVVGSTIARETDAGVYNHAGPEIGVASTKAFTSQLTIFALLAVFLGRQNGRLSLKEGKVAVKEIEKLPNLVREILKRDKKIKELAEKYSAKGGSASGRKDYNNFLYIGRKYNFPTALEGALKLKEISYIHAEGYGAGEMKHGPIALIDENFPTIAVAPSDSVYSKMISNMEEIKARRGKIVVIATEGNEEIKSIADDWLYIPKILEMLTPILSVITLQLFAYYMGVLRGIDVDKPRNLAKSVTVE
ncbi:MAG: Isomerizing Glutamine-fructose-6-phosphate aminotransferase [Candidatus Azambacteria bacterium GW2011_GWA1_44_9]|uniref:Glutamine--fructose-6-phosphate aminotransferase [isomerizing] n=1 Tax=Candidatus Azambacteria bacterium GW2011_GWA1_44_9 TaxID=1618610 RepID=A0A0G1MIR5_9BACT|nr:MAG: Isomerizing Glutamine-fructose-6-phosphate aminotransferase [Candidatus Azambacteria bacterium GW2011_GWA1_44_9]